MIKKLGFSIVLSLGLANGLHAADFTVEDGEIETTTQVLSDAGDVGKVEELGTINVAGNNVHGISMQNDAQQVVNHGIVVTSGDNAHAIINNRGDNSQIINDGYVRTSGLNSTGIRNANGIGVNILNTGSVATSGAGGWGIYNFQGHNSTINNQGSIHTEGDGGRGIETQSANNVTIISSGLIETKNDSGDAIAAFFSNDLNVQHSGLIKTEGYQAFGIHNFTGNNAVILQTGTIMTSGDTGYGLINEDSENAQIVNDGLITTTGSSAHGLYNSDSHNALISNGGSIDTSGSNSYGVYIDTSNNVTFKNTGMINVSGNTSFGVLFTQSSNSHLINSGTIISDSGTAIWFANSTDRPTLTLQQGSNIQGSVRSDLFYLNLNVEKGLNLQLNLSELSHDFGTLNIDAPYVLLNGKSISVLDKTLFAMQVDIAHDLSDTVLDAIDHDCCRKDCGCGLWTKTVGSYRYRRENDELVSYNDKQIGQLLGLDKEWGKSTFSFFGGYIYGEGQADGHLEKACYDTYLGGLAFTTSWCDNCIGLTFAGGYVDWDQERMIMANEAEGGVVIGESSASATFITSEFLLSHQMCLDCLNPRFSFGLRHSGLYFGNYAEEGFDEAISIRNRDIDILTIRLEASAPFGFHCFCLEPFVGVYGRYQLRGEGIEVAGARSPFDSGSISDVEAVFFGLRGEGHMGRQELSFSLSGDLDYDNSSRFVGNVGIRF